MTIVASDNDLLPVASFTKLVNPRLAKRPLVFNGRLGNCGLTSLVKEVTVTKALSGQIEAYCKLDPIWHISVKF